jgi:hypothetical protein
MPYTQHGLPWAPQSETSHQAAIAAQSFSGEQGAAVLAWVTQQGANGATQKEMERGTGYSRASIAARVNELWKVGRLVKTGERREGCAVYRPAGEKSEAA